MKLGPVRLSAYRSSLPRRHSILAYSLDRNLLVVEPQGDCSSLDAVVLDQEFHEILNRVRSNPSTECVIDLQQASYFGSTMLAGMIRLWRAARAGKGRLVLCNVSSLERDVLSAVRLDNVWGIYPTRSAAIAALQSRPAG
jgi:anti-anti-sigma factor